MAKWIHTHGLAALQPTPPVAPVLPAARSLAWLLLQPAEHRTPEEQTLWEQLQHHPDLPQVTGLIQQGREMIRQRQVEGLEPWLQACAASPSVEVQSFAEVLQRDYAAVKAALQLPWSSGQVDGQINRVKLIKRSGYGRMHLDLLSRRVLYPP